MNTQPVKQESSQGSTALTTHGTELENIASAAEQDGGFDKTFKFVKGKFFFNEEEEIPLDTKLIAHPEAWIKTWTKYVDDEVVERKVYHIAKGEKPPEREDLDDLHLIGTKNKDGLSADCWVLRNLLGFEHPASGEPLVFSTPSIGGRRAIADLCKIYARRVAKFGGGLPIIKLATVDMPTK